MVLNVAWISFIDAHVFSGGGELTQRALLDVGRRRGHRIQECAFLHGRLQRLARRSGLLRRLAVDWSADAFVLTNIRNLPAFPRRIPASVIDRALSTGRAAVNQEAWVDVCPFDVPCDGHTDRCHPACSREFANRLYSQARAAIFNSPLQREVIGSVLDVPLPSRQIFSRPQVDPDVFRPLDGERDIDVLYVGTVSEAKGYTNLIKRFGADRLTFAGPNALGRPVEGTYLGRLEYEALPELYNRARTFAHLPRWLEPMGRTPVEAALCGCEVVLNERVGVATYPRHEWTNADFIRGNGDRFWNDLEAAYA